MRHLEAFRIVRSNVTSIVFVWKREVTYSPINTDQYRIPWFYNTPEEWATQWLFSLIRLIVMVGWFKNHAIQSLFPSFFLLSSYFTLRKTKKWGREKRNSKKQQLSKQASNTNKRQSIYKKILLIDLIRHRCNNRSNKS